jgi:hypothetical protein
MGGVFKWVQPKAVDIRRRRALIIRRNLVAEGLAILIYITE